MVYPGKQQQQENLNLHQERKQNNTQNAKTHKKTQKT